MPTPDEFDAQHTLRTAAARHEELRYAEVLAPGVGSVHAEAPALTREDALELLALGTVIARKATYGRQLTVRTARAAGASWAQIAAALGVDEREAAAAHTAWIARQAAQAREDR